MFELVHFVHNISSDSFSLHEMERASIAISNLLNRYITFLEDLLRIEYVYKDLIDHYIHKESRFLNEKCKTDPIWLAYNRAYKAHYARYMKKKMTIAEFETWSAYAIELREKMLDNKLVFKEYQKEIKK